MSNEKRNAVLEPCPFCRARPHHGLSKVMYDALHGDPYQRFLVWCPKGHAKVDKINREQAFAAWNTRQPTQSDVLRIKLLEDALLAVVEATRAYLPPDEIDAKECLSRILEATDNPSINPIIFEIEDRAALQEQSK